MEMQTKERIIDWNHIYLLAWYGPDGRPYLTTWSGDLPYITVVVTGPDVQKWGPPLWDAPANCKPNPYWFPSHHFSEYQLHEVKPDEDPTEKARQLGGVKAMGWYFEKPFERKWHESQ
ncbi:hypothetical protein ES703_00110 [subsurface metagenome]